MFLKTRKPYSCLNRHPESMVVHIDKTRSCSVMKIFAGIRLLIFLACVGCRVGDISYFEHPPTNQFRKNNRPYVTEKDFEENPQFVDSGVFFVPFGRELA